MRVDLEEVLEQVKGHSFWGSYFSSISRGEIHAGLHVAVFVEPFLSYVLDGTKTTESRFSKVKCAPFGEITRGDVIFIKRASGPICGVTLAENAWFYDLSYEPLDRIRDVHGEAIRADPEFWEGRRNANYVTLVELSNQISLNPISFMKRDRRGWVSLRSRQLGISF